MKQKLQIFGLLFIYFSINSWSQTNVRGQMNVNNTQIFYSHFAHQDDNLIPTSAKEYFKPYLAYYKNSTYSEPLMDSFLFLDLGFFNTIGYDEELWDIYLNNFFIKTKLPIIRNSGSNNYAVIPETIGSGLSYGFFNVNSAQNITIEFDAKALLKPGHTTLSQPDLVVGIEFFDTNGDEIRGGNNFSTYNDAYTQNIFIDVYNNNFQSKAGTFSIPANANSYKIHIINWKLGTVDRDYPAKIAIDNVKLYEDNSTTNLIDITESNFDYLGNDTQWELNLMFGHGSYLPFNTRNPLIEELNSANLELSNSINLPNTKIILQLPVLDYKDYPSSSARNQLKIDLENYLDKIETMSQNWNSNNNSKVDIEGIYYLKESVSNNYYDSSSTGPLDVNFSVEIFSHLKPIIENKGWHLYGSPYQLFSFNPPITSFADEITKIFDVTWQQPSAFSNGSVFGGVDRDLLKNANRIMSTQNLNVNIENEVLAEDEIYGRVNDYFDYGDKFGYINYGKVYYDTSGAHYKNANSSVPEERVDYNNLYKFIKKSKAGVLINNRFEIKNEELSNKLHHWNGNYEIYKNKTSNAHFRDLNFTADFNNNTVYSKIIPVKETNTYKLSYKVKELISDGQSYSSLIGVKFYDINGNPLTNLNTNTSNLIYSSALNSYFKYTDTNLSFQDDLIHFVPPSNAVSFQFFLRKWRSANIEWKSIRLIKNNDIENSNLIYRAYGEDSLSVEKENFAGKNSLKLSKDQYAVTLDTITIIPNQDYTLKLKAREKLPILDNRNTKALVAIETFDSNGNKLTNSISINGFLYSSSLQMHFSYIPTHQEWSTTLKTFQFPGNVNSIRIYLRNWIYNNTVYIDNLSLDLDQNVDIVRNLNDENIFIRTNWSEKLPLEIENGESLYYNDFIDVSNIDKLNFSALIRGSGESPNGDLLALEFYDSNYNLLSVEDINTQETNLSFSSYYKHWWMDYIDIPYQTREENQIEYDNAVDKDLVPKWYRDQWDIYERNLEIPSAVSYVKFYFQKINGDREFKVLNPQLKIVNTPGTIFSKPNNNLALTTFKNNSIIIYPNPSDTYIQVSHLKFQFSKYAKFEIYDVTGKLVRKGNLKNNLINTSSLEVGLYLLNIQDKDKVFNTKFLKK
ncbi:T9SS type A sorting domain-containing protein [Mesonia sp. K4-1]|uniref:T9SS type A sorting domain-containing protein n=1 Tax=Mesonia sp. K4-1 TaxID=2602760 RepID=UPI0011CAA5E1|nr:T9SS type A sorting domain-containing protein [Mesonia sp. K4-1]TXK78517.1 DUF4855 domain-containing protein [Mesonia sp. K4-1]